MLTDGHTGQYGECNGRIFLTFQLLTRLERHTEFVRVLMIWLHEKWAYWFQWFIRYCNEMETKHKFRAAVTDLLTTLSRALLENLVVAQLVKKFPAFM
jgi:hypothetical protein